MITYRYNKIHLNNENYSFYGLLFSFLLIMAPGMTKKFSNAGRSHSSDALRAMRPDVSSARFSVQYLRPKVRAVLLKISAGERVHPEIIRINLSGCVKSACLKAVVFTIPSKVKGLRIQSTDVFLGDPGLGKGLSAEWCEDFLKSTKTMLMDYAHAQYHGMQFPVQGPLNEGVERKIVEPRVFKHFDGEQRDGGKKISWVWRYRCCHSRITIFRDSMFYNSHYGPGAILEILWKMSSRTPVSMISRLILGVESSEVFKWVTFFRDVTGWYEDKHIMIMGGSVYRREPLINVFLWVYFWSSCR